MARVACLLECGLTATVHAQECPTDKEIGLFSIGTAERSKTNEKLQSEMFPALAKKALMVIEATLKQATPSRSAGSLGKTGKLEARSRMGILQSAGVSFNGEMVSRSMFAAITLFAGGTTRNRSSSSAASNGRLETSA